jgi:pimeloyl-ACP methyl ester carboxylesterase
MRLEVDGAPVFAATGGVAFDAARPVVVLVHGAGMDHSVWALQSRYLAHHGRAVLAVDLPGHGLSGGAPLESVDALADWLVRLLDALGVARAALVGHSMGALAALESAARHAQRWRALGLLGVAAKMPVHPDLLAAAEADDPAAAEIVVAWGHGPRARFGGNAVPGVWTTGAALNLLARARPGVLHTDLAACNAYARGEAAAGEVRCPTLLVLAAHDRMTPAKAGRKLGAAIADARVVELPGCGHLMMTEAPDATLDALAGFV